ncbi:MAG: hypothetical protein AAFY01_04055 [Pseudomonadota bacterium]
MDTKSQFSAWPTPFENQQIELLEIAFTPVVDWPDSLGQALKRTSCIIPESGRGLTIRIATVSPITAYRVCFEWVSAFRVLDEGALSSLWARKEATAPSISLSSFRIQANEMHPDHWSGLVLQEHWTYFLATGDDCVEVITGCEPLVKKEKVAVE